MRIMYTLTKCISCYILQKSFCHVFYVLFCQVIFNTLHVQRLDMFRSELIHIMIYTQKIKFRLFSQRMYIQLYHISYFYKITASRKILHLNNRTPPYFFFFTLMNLSANWSDFMNKIHVATRFISFNDASLIEIIFLFIKSLYVFEIWKN